MREQVQGVVLTLQQVLVVQRRSDLVLILGQGHQLVVPACQIRDLLTHSGQLVEIGRQALAR